jgi:hypothetical protein
MTSDVGSIIGIPRRTELMASWKCSHPARLSTAAGLANLSVVARMVIVRLLFAGERSARLVAAERDWGVRIIWPQAGS